MDNRVKYTVDDILSNTFYKLPKFLFKENLKDISNDARILYCLLKDRLEDSAINLMFNEDGELYVVMTRNEMEQKLNLSALAVRKAIKELENTNLIKEKRQGLNKPNLIFILR